MKLSIILCTFNPRRHFIERTLDALRGQTLSSTQWELILVDNNSRPPLASWLNLQGLPEVRIVIETEQGFTPALIRGVREATGEVCILVHDDNLLAPDYLAHVHRLAREWPQLGAWGGGYVPEYEEPPDPELAPFIAYLAVNAIERDRWSNALYDYPATPCGAGMAVRSVVLRRWVEITSNDARRRSLGRHTDKLTSCEDFDIAFTAIDAGYGTGVFTCLKITHLIPKGRVRADYLRRLVEGHGYSSVLLHSFRGPVRPPARGLLARLRRWRYLRTLSLDERDVQTALARGEARAYAALARQG
ncbi:MAG: glycosyltransferase family 2 protein [Verrucomicrobia bacterium]|nr:glycosyltransferase family 2 protein [Verrucomicrobiota bacterium]